MFKVRRTPEFQAWLDDLKDRRAAAKILTRIHRAEGGNLGDVKALGLGVSEMRIPYGPGYRLYFITEGSVLIVLLCGGDKSSQTGDIKRAKALASVWKG